MRSGIRETSTKTGPENFARLVFEKSSGFHESAGPWEGGRIGFSIGDRVFWTDSYSFPGDSTASHAEKVAFAHEIVVRLNCGGHTLENGPTGLADATSNPHPTGDKEGRS